MSELTLFYILVAITAPILFLWLVCWLCMRKRTLVIDPQKDLAKIGLEFVEPIRDYGNRHGYTDEEWDAHRKEVMGKPILIPEDVKAEAHDSLFLRFAEDKLTELKRK